MLFTKLQQNRRNPQMGGVSRTCLDIWIVCWIILPINLILEVVIDPIFSLLTMPTGHAPYNQSQFPSATLLLCVNIQRHICQVTWNHPIDLSSVGHQILSDINSDIHQLHFLCVSTFKGMYMYNVRMPSHMGSPN